MENEIVIKGVKECLREALGVDESQMSLNSSIVTDLGGESIDFLDIIFRLERHFGIKISRGEIAKTAQGDMKDDDFIKDGIVTTEGLKQLKLALPEVSEDMFKEGMSETEIPKLFTIQTFINLVIKKQKEKGQ